jgi:hypothetical protein
MIKITDTNVYGWEAAIRGMRNPMNSWDKSDSYKSYIEDPETQQTADFEFFVGENDHDLMMRLAKGGSVHAKYRRMITVTLDITAPLYWWKEFDTYKVGTVANSCSTMHKIHAKEFTFDDFSHEYLNAWSMIILNDTIRALNFQREQYLVSKNKDDWYQMIQLLPSSYNQKRTVQLNYEVAVRIIQQREGHKLTEWAELVEVLKNLPYMKEIMNFGGGTL